LKAIVNIEFYIIDAGCIIMSFDFNGKELITIKVYDNTEKYSEDEILIWKLF
jgi:hypothetical protein